MKAIHKKLMAIKKEIGAIEKTKENPFFKRQRGGHKYFDINVLLEHLNPLLERENLLLLQPIIGDKLYTRIVDVDTGEEEASYMDLIDMPDPQKLGSLITYYRRYSLQSLLSLQAEDDDGNAASEPKKKIWLTDKQFEIALKATPKQIKSVLEKYNGNGHAMKKEYREKLEALLNDEDVW